MTRARRTVEDCRRRKGNDLKCVINMSIGGPKSTSVNTAIDNAVRAGLHVVVAAGNDATDACNKSPASAPLVNGGCIILRIF